MNDVNRSAVDESPGRRSHAFSQRSLMDAIVETEQEERERLAQAPVGSTNHGLSQLPVSLHEWPEGMLIELPQLPNAEGAVEPYRLVVVPYRYEASHSKGDNGKIRRHGGHWTCVVVHSTHPSYRRGGYHLSISGEELSRGKLIELLS